MSAYIRAACAAPSSSSCARNATVSLLMCAVNARRMTSVSSSVKSIVVGMVVSGNNPEMFGDIRGVEILILEPFPP
jgi:hypothetical protein